MTSRPRPSSAWKSLAAAGAGLLACGSPVASRAADPPVAHLRFPVLFEPVSGPVTVPGEVRLSAPAAGPVVLRWSTADGTATAGEDYSPVSSGEVTLPAGAISAPVELTLLPDTLVEEDTETLRAEITILSGPAAAEPPTERTIRDTDRPGIVYAADTTCWESAPPVNAEVRLYPAPGAPLTVASEAFTPEIYATGAPLAELGYAVPGEDWPALPASFTSAVSGSRFLSLAGTDDATVDGNRRALLGFGLPVGAVAASFSERLSYSRKGVENLSFDFSSPTTDGDWAAAVRVIYEDTSLLLFRRRPGPGPGGGWRLEATLPPSFVGRTSWFGTWIKLRRGVLAVYDFAAGTASFFRAPSGAGTEWTLESAQSGIPAEVYSTALSFDGETLAMALKSRQILTVNRDGGSWTGRQTVDLPGNSPEKPLMALNDGLLAWHLPSQSPRQGVSFMNRTGGGPAPWEVLPASIPAPEGDVPISRLLLEGNVIAVRTGARAPLESRIHRRTDDGNWVHEQAVPEILDLGRGVMMSGGTVFADLGPADAPWRALGAAPPAYTDSGYGSDFSRGVWIRTASYSSETLKIMEGGMGFDIVDEDSFALRVEPSVSFQEPAYAVTHLPAAVRCATGVAPVDITVPYETVPGGTATEGTDYLPVRGTLVIPAGRQSFSFAVPVLPDTLPENAETIQVRLGAPSYGRLENSLATLTIRENPPVLAAPDLPVSVPEPVSGEAVYTIPFTLTSGTSSEDLTVHYLIEGISASSQDVRLFPFGGKSVTIPAGSAVAAIPLTVLADSRDEGPERVVIRIERVGPNGSGSVSLPFTETIVTIDDTRVSEAVPDVFTAPQNTVLEPAPERNALANDMLGHPAVSPAWPPRHGAVTWLPDGTFRYTPPPNFIGTDRFAYTSRLVSLPADQTWKFLHPVNGKDPGTANPVFTADWMKAGFDDSAWRNGKGLMGYGLFGPGDGSRADTGIGTPPESMRFSAFFRGKVTLPVDLAPVPGVGIEFLCDDAAVFYLNGVEIGRWAYHMIASFTAAPDTYKLMAPTAMGDVEETTVRRVWFPAAQMLPGENTVAVSLHNATQSSDLGLQILQLSPGRIAGPAYVTVEVQDAGLPPVIADDSIVLRRATGFPYNPPVVDSRRLGSGVYGNDGLLSENGRAYDPILEVETGGIPAGPLTFDRDTGHFVMEIPGDFYGLTSFTYRVRDKDGWSNTATVSLRVPPSNPYASWRITYFTPAESATAGGLPGDDEDGDGMVNALEYTLGQDPTHPEVWNPLRITRDGSSVSVHFDRVFLQGADSALFLESSDTLSPGGWTRLGRMDNLRTTDLAPGVTAGTTAVPQPDGSVRHFQWFTLPDDSAPRRYFRLRVADGQTVANP